MKKLGVLIWNLIQLSDPNFLIWKVMKHLPELIQLSIMLPSSKSCNKFILASIIVHAFPRNIIKAHIFSPLETSILSTFSDLSSILCQQSANGVSGCCNWSEHWLGANFVFIKINYSIFKYIFVLGIDHVNSGNVGWGTVTILVMFLPTAASFIKSFVNYLWFKIQRQFQKDTNKAGFSSGWKHLPFVQAFR